MGVNTDIEDNFVEAYVNYLQAEKYGSASISLKGELSKARALAKEQLTGSEYDDAVFRAHKFSRLA